VKNVWGLDSGNIEDHWVKNVWGLDSGNIEDHPMFGDSD
jgi:hypothetical protein